MRADSFSTGRAFVLVLTILLAGTSVMAEKPGSKKDNGPEKSKAPRYENERERDGSKRDSDGKRQREEVRPGGYFRDEHRAVIRDYYGREYGVGQRCPPGLAKKHNGCLPPGQAKRWVIGRVLPRDVIYYSVDAPVVARLGPPPPGHQFVRVAGDILLIAIGTGMVMDAIEDLGR